MALLTAFAFVSVLFPFLSRGVKIVGICQKTDAKAERNHRMCGIPADTFCLGHNITTLYILITIENIKTRFIFFQN